MDSAIIASIIGAVAALAAAALPFVVKPWRERRKNHKDSQAVPIEKQNPGDSGRQGSDEPSTPGGLLPGKPNVGRPTRPGLELSALVTAWNGKRINLRGPCLQYYNGYSYSEDYTAIRVKKDSVSLRIEWRRIRLITFSRKAEADAFKISVDFADGTREDFTLSEQGSGLNGVLKGELGQGTASIKLKDIETIEVDVE